MTSHIRWARHYASSVLTAPTAPPASTHPARHALGQVNPFIVGAAMPDDVAHPMGKTLRFVRRQRVASRSSFDESRDAAHTINSPFSPWSLTNAAPTGARSRAAAHVLRRTRAPRILVR